MNTSTEKSEHPLVLFDGICNLCNGSVQAVIKRDSKKIFRFASLQSEHGQKQLNDLAFDPIQLDSVVLVHKGMVHIKSDAVLQIFSLMGAWGKSILLLRIVPRFLRDIVYDWVAKHRYGWFGKQDSCMIPSPELEDRFLG